MEPYYYTQMNKTEQAAYHAMKTGFSALAASFSVPRLAMRELSDIFFKLRLDCPEIFYVVSFKCRSYSGADSMELVPDYLFEKGKIKEQQKAMRARVEKLARQAASLSPWDKELFIHDFICTGVRYDKLKKPYSHEIIGPLGQGVGVCEGIAKTVKILCDALGIRCMIAISDANPDRGIKYRHAWNVVELNGQSYHLDVTFDNTLSRAGARENTDQKTDGLIRYDYFNLDDKRFFRDHEPAMYRIPACTDTDHFYYREKKLSFTKTEEVAKRAAQALRKNRPLIFHWRGGYLTREQLKELLDIMEQTAREKGRYLAVGLNWPQAVLKVSFPAEAPGHEIVTEEANEGEKETDENIDY